MRIVSLITGIFLTAYICRHVIRFVSRYGQLKRDIADGDPSARIRVYREALVFEWTSAVLALAAVFAGGYRFAPTSLGLNGTGLFGVPLALGAFARGVFAGAVLGTVGLIGIRLVANRHNSGFVAPQSRWRGLLRKRPVSAGCRSYSA